MTARGLFEGALVELSKVNAPPLLIEDFNYFINKAFNQFINKSYNLYDVNQQYSDNLRVLKSTAIIPATKSSKTEKTSGLYDPSVVGNLHGATYEVELPQDYLHLLNCVCYYKLLDNDKCHKKDSVMAYAAKRLTADSWSVVLNNFYNRPTPQRPYYYIHNVNTSTKLPTNPYSTTNTQGTDMNGAYNASSNSNFPRTITLGTNKDENIVEKSTAVRIGNPTPIRCEIRYGKDDSVYQLTHVSIDYLKVPQNIELTQEQVDLTKDTSQIIEFPDYVCQEIINELVHLIMENQSDPRLQTHIPVSQSIIPPTQQQTQQSK